MSPRAAPSASATHPTPHDHRKPDRTASHHARARLVKNACSAGAAAEGAGERNDGASAAMRAVFAASHVMFGRTVVTLDVRLLAMRRRRRSNAAFLLLHNGAVGDPARNHGFDIRFVELRLQSRLPHHRQWRGQQHRVPSRRRVCCTHVRGGAVCAAARAPSSSASRRRPAAARGLRSLRRAAAAAARSASAAGLLSLSRVRRAFGSRPTVTVCTGV